VTSVIALVLCCRRRIRLQSLPAPYHFYFCRIAECLVLLSSDCLSPLHDTRVGRVAHRCHLDTAKFQEPLLKTGVLKSPC
jgi:hypothetical protein